MKRSTLLLFIVICFSACKSNRNTDGCGMQPCTASFAYLGIRLINNQGHVVTPKNFSAVNLRTNKTLTSVQYPPAIDFAAGFVLLTSDANIKDFSTDGDDVKVTATDSLTNQTKTATLKIAGGCNCHISKISGPDIIVFD